MLHRFNVKKAGQMCGELLELLGTYAPESTEVRTAFEKFNNYTFPGYPLYETFLKELKKNNNVEDTAMFVIFLAMKNIKSK